MPRFSLHKLPQDERIRLIGEFYTAVALLRNRDDAAKVFRDIMNGDEIGNIMRRIDIAILLYAGYGYDDIVELLGVGKNKISAVDKKLQRGGEGYNLLIKRILEQRRGRKIRQLKKMRKAERQRNAPDIELLKKKYPGPFLFWNILDEIADSFDAHAAVKSDREGIKEYYTERKK